MSNAERSADYIRRIVAEAPPLNNEQRDMIAGFFRSEGGEEAKPVRKLSKFEAEIERLAEGVEDV